MTTEFQPRPAKRENVSLLLGLAGGTGSGKTWTAMELAKGLSGGKRFGVVDTENGRAEHYADSFDFDVVRLDAPFTPQRYRAAIQALYDAGHRVIVIDSASHEHAGDGGLLDQHDSELDKRAGDDFRKREVLNMSCWVNPKRDHKRFVSWLLQVDAHLIFCFRAEEKIEMVKENGKTKIVPKRSLKGLDGWEPISEKNLPYEMTLSLLFTADQPGVAKPIKLQQQHRPFVPLDSPITEETGRRLGEWAAGTTTPASSDLNADADELVELLVRMSSQPDQTRAALDGKRREMRLGEFLAFLNAKVAEKSAA